MIPATPSHNKIVMEFYEEGEGRITPRDERGKSKTLCTMH